MLTGYFVFMTCAGWSARESHFYKKHSMPSKGWGEASRTGLASEEDELSEYSCNLAVILACCDS